MNISIKFTRIAGVAAALSIALASQSAVAAAISVNYAGSADFGSGQVGYAFGQIAPNPNSPNALAGVGVGGDSDTTDVNPSYAFTSTGHFNSWCVDIYHWLANGVSTYNVEADTDLASTLDVLRPGTGTTRVQDLELLANEVYGSLHTQSDSAAFQLAVWAITYGTPDGTGLFSINSTDPNFQVDAATLTQPWGVQANGWLSNLFTAPVTGHYALAYLSDGTTGANGGDGSTQDLVVFTSVPEPTTLALFGLGLFAIGASRRRKA